MAETAIEGWPTSPSPTFEPVRFRAGDVIFREGDPSGDLYRIEAGEVRLEVHTTDVDTDGVLGYVGPGAYLGEVGLLAGSPRSASAYAETDVRAERLSSESFANLCATHPAERSSSCGSSGARSPTGCWHRPSRSPSTSRRVRPTPWSTTSSPARRPPRPRSSVWPEDRIDAHAARCRPQRSRPDASSSGRPPSPRPASAKPAPRRRRSCSARPVCTPRFAGRARLWSRVHRRRAARP